MAKTRATAIIGDTWHPKYGRLVAGQEYLIDEKDLGALFCNSPLEKGDKGGCDPLSATQEEQQPEPGATPARPRKKKEE